jgi:hypothetical protein
MITMTVVPLGVAALVGLLSGTHAAIWGMYKDAIHEGFAPRSFARSVIVGAAVAVGVQALMGLALPGPAALAMLFGLAYAAERGAVEVWKTFVREEDQTKYFIPMQFSIRGVPVESRGARLAAGAAYVAAVGFVLASIARLDANPVMPVAPLVPAHVALTALAMGFVVALGGAWKDSPKEGFDTFKFFRSPGLTVLFALLLAPLTTSYLEATVAAVGYERATAETYKTFFLAGRPPGKFAGKPVRYPEMFARRRRFVPLYAAISAAAIASGLVALRDGAGTSVTPSQSAQVVAPARYTRPHLAQ